VKRKQIVSFIMTAFILIVTCVALTETAKAAMDEDIFLEEIIKAIKANDLGGAVNLIQKASLHVLYESITKLSMAGINFVAQGKDGSFFFEVAETIATFYAKQLKQEALLDLVRKYKLYNQHMCKENLRGYDLISEGDSINLKRQWNDALKKYNEALAIFKNLGDMAGEAKAIIGTGNVYTNLGKYNEALNYYKHAIGIWGRIGNLAGGAEALNKIGNVYNNLRNYIEALNYYKQAHEINQVIRNASGEANSCINIGGVYFRLGQYTEALNYYRQSVEISRKIGFAAGEAAALIGIGNAHYTSGKYNEALDYYQQALEIRRKIGGTGQEAGTLSNIGAIYEKLGKYIESLNFYKQALEVSRKIGDADGEALALNNIKNVYTKFGKHDEAVNYYKQALENRRKIGDKAGEAKILNDIGTIYIDLGRYAEALEYFKQALDIRKRISDVAGESSCLMNIGVVYERLGQYAGALRYLKQSLEMKQKIGDVAGEANILNGIGVIYERFGQYSEALGYHKQALEISRRIGNLAEEARTLDNIGTVYSQLGQYTEALTYHKQALEMSRRIGDVDGEGGILGNLGNVYLKLGQYAEAMDYYNQNFEMSRKIGDVAKQAKTLNNIGIIYKSLGKYTQALDCYRQTLEIQIKTGDLAGQGSSLINMGALYYSLGQYKEATEAQKEAIDISERLGELETVWRGHMGLGEVLWKSGKRGDAVAHYKKAVEAIEELYQFTEGLKEEERSSMIGEKSIVYKRFIELLLELHKKSPNKGYDKEAFIISEKSKSRTFQELMAKAGAKIAFSGDETFKKMVNREQQLIGKITNLRGLLTQELSKPEKQRNEEAIKSLKEQILKAEKSLSELEKEIGAKYPRYADLKRPKPLTVEELQKILKPDETVVSYAVGKDKMATFVIGKKSFKLIEIGTGREELSKLIRRFRRGLEDVKEIKDLEKFKPEVAYELFRKIFYPLTSELKGMTKLYISSDDILYTLPFEALVDKEINEKAFDEARERGKVYLSEYNTLHYLVDTYTITYLPSASVLRSLRKYEKPGYGKWSKPLIAFADPIFSLEESKRDLKGMKGKGISQETQLTVQILTRSTGNEKLERLKESAQEAEAISKELKGRREDIYLREKATEENIYKTNLKDSRYILFSTHGLLGGDFLGVAEPALALTLIDNPPGRDGFLTMSEVLGLDLNSELIILSACNTSGRGDKAGSGEGFVGLTRSFMYAGGKSLLVTHWSVESESARDLMVNTMRLMKNNTKPESLRESKLNMKKSIRQKGQEKLSLSPPFFWAPFVLVGEGK
jgi:tetratricopeptide (TPR) repeat protein